MTAKNHKSAARRLVTAMLALIMTLGMITAAAGTVHAAAQTVTLKYGSQIWFGDHPLYAPRDPIRSINILHFSFATASTSMGSSLAIAYVSANT